MKNKKQNKFSNVSMGFSIASIFLLPILFGPTAFILAIIGTIKDEEKALTALLMSIFLPLLSFIITILFLATLF